MVKRWSNGGQRAVRVYAPGTATAVKTWSNVVKRGKKKSARMSPSTAAVKLWSNGPQSFWSNSSQSGQIVVLWSPHSDQKRRTEWEIRETF